MQRIIQLIIASLIFIILPAQADQLAGEVTAAMGEARIVASAAGERAAAQGMPLQVGDILQTGPGGHMHIRMVDDALISLRPNSKLRITQYAYQPGVTATTQIRFDLLQGTVRSVTGKGGELAKERFRMNTPVAAIGVRGTDFIVQSDTETTLVNVQSGAIVLAPLGDGCLANVLGPCQTDAARELTAGMRNMMLKFNRGADEPKLVPLGEGLQILPAPGQHSQTRSSAPVPEKLQIDSAKQTLDNLAAQLPAHYQMVWGHWSASTSGGDLGRAFLDAAGGREVTVGNTATGLFRDNTGPMALPLSGRTEFTLREAQVTLSSSGIAGTVQNASLGVSFDTQTFNTKLDIQHPALANTATLNAFGSLRSDGMLYSLAGISNGSVAGSLSRDGAEAGYQFQLPTTAGALTGTTLWVK
ncbi:MAG: FecR family protein [Sulfurimicrobium sp.]|nr:FecR family protein [Sulfurimicrobium sp.]